MKVLALETKLGPLLVPVSMVAEILGVMKLQQSSYQRGWILGDFHWREYLVPLVCSAGALGADMEESTQYARTVILWPMKDSSPVNFFALTGLGAPRVIDIDSEPAPDQSGITGQLDHLLGYVQLKDRIGIIPDLKNLAHEIFRNV